MAAARGVPRGLLLPVLLLLTLCGGVRLSRPPASFADVLAATLDRVQTEIEAHAECADPIASAFTPPKSKLQTVVETLLHGEDDGKDVSPSVGPSQQALQQPPQPQPPQQPQNPQKPHELGRVDIEGAVKDDEDDEDAENQVGLADQVTDPTEETSSVEMTPPKQTTGSVPVFTKRVPLPDVWSSEKQGLRPVSVESLVEALGGVLSVCFNSTNPPSHPVSVPCDPVHGPGTCSPLTNERLKILTGSETIGSRGGQVMGLLPTLEALNRVWEQVRFDHPFLYRAAEPVGMLCCHKTASGEFSVHSWGVAIDVAIDGKLDAQNDGQAFVGLVKLAPYFHNEGFYWGAAQEPANPMHFIPSEALFAQWVAEDKLERSGENRDRRVQDGYSAAHFQEG